jgi:hypothetical protein
VTESEFIFAVRELRLSFERRVAAVFSQEVTHSHHDSTRQTPLGGGVQTSPKNERTAGSTKKPRSVVPCPPEVAPPLVVDPPSDLSRDDGADATVRLRGREP